MQKESQEKFAEEGLRQRQEELISQLNLLAKQTADLKSQDPESLKLDDPTFQNFTRVVENVTKVKTDWEWVKSMQESGVPVDKILEVWNRKDEHSRNAKAKGENPQIE